MLWNKTNEALSMPKWYARQCFTQGDVCVAEDGHLDLSTANTQFATGDAVILFSESPIGGLANEGVYYLRREPSDPTHYHYSVHASREKAKGEGKGIALTAGSGEQLFVKYDTKKTTADATEGFAIVLIDTETAKKKIDGLVSPGWWRYTKYETSAGTSRIHRELLVSFRAEPVEEGGDDESFSGGGTPDDEGRTTPSVTVTKIGDWVVNAYNEFTVDVAANDFAVPMTLSISGLEHVELLEENKDGTWTAVDASSIEVTGSKQRFRFVAPYVDDGSADVTLGVSLAGEGFEPIVADGKLSVTNEPNSHTVDFATIDSATVL